MIPNAIVPSFLLAAAKDARYIEAVAREMAHLLQPLLKSSSARRSTYHNTMNNRNGSTPHQKHHLVSLAIASLAYTIVSLRLKNRTFGMEACGLVFHQPESGKHIRQWRWLAVTAAAALMVLWKNITSDLYSLDICNVFSAPFTTRQPLRGDASISTDLGSSNDNNEVLRGSQRRQIFEVQRQRMIQRSLASTMQNVPSESSEPTPPSSSLAGRSERSSGRAPHHRRPNQPPARGRALGQWLIGVCESILRVFPEGPHTIGEGASPPSETTLSLSPSRVVAWLGRFQLGCFLLSSQQRSTVSDKSLQSSKTRAYPTWWHKLVDASLQQESNRETSLVNIPSSVHTVGYIILAQCAWTALRHGSRLALERWIDSVAKRRRPENPRSILFHRDTTTIRTLAANSSENSNNSDVRPSSSTTPSTTTASSSSLRHDRVKRRPDAFPLRSPRDDLCAVCQQVRRNAACSIHCGHVLCWTCYQNWVTVVRAECPLCRAPCQSRDIMALRDYSSSSGI